MVKIDTLTFAVKNEILELIQEKKNLIKPGR